MGRVIVWIKPKDLDTPEGMKAVQDACAKAAAILRSNSQIKSISINAEV